VRRLAPCHTAGSVSRTANHQHRASTRSTQPAHPQHTSGVETMSTTQPVGRTAAAPPLRVRDQAREAAALIAFSAATACGLALALLLLTHLGSQG
jgi:hypothetical protein